MSQNQISTVDIYTEYVRLRQGGWSKDAAVAQLQNQANELTKSELQQLGSLVQAWESREGEQYNTASGLKPSVVRSLNKQTASPSGNSVIRPIAPRSTTANSTPSLPPIEPSGPMGDPTQRQICSNCGKLNNSRDSYCFACGHILLGSTTGTRQLDGDMDPGMRWGTAHFGQFSTMVLNIRGGGSLEIAPQAETIIGRSDSDSAMRPDIDLAAFNAEELGVSRLHATLKRSENTVTITDLNSRNNTYINGQRLHSNEVRALRDGDEIRLGRLTLKVTFKHNVKRLNNR